MVSAGQTMKTIGDCCAYLGNEKGIAGGALLIIKHNQNPKYLAYSLSTSNAVLQNQKYADEGAIINIYASKIKKIKIPIPSLEIQQKIANALDLFRGLTETLKVELSLRKQQYEYYRDKLISDVIENKIGKYKTLGEIITDIYRGNGITKEQIGTGNHPCVHYSEIYTKYNICIEKCFSTVDPSLIKNPKYCEHGDLLIADASVMLENIGKTCTYLGNEKAIAGNHVMVIKHNQNPKYLSYALSTSDAVLQKQKYAQKGTVIDLYTAGIKKIKIPIPPIEVQNQIVETLDALRELCEDLKAGIPREIELSMQRYEYYRDLLITGKK